MNGFDILVAFGLGFIIVFLKKRFDRLTKEKDLWRQSALDLNSKLNEQK